MSQMQPDEVDWQVLLGQLIIAKQRVYENDVKKLEPFTVPRVKATEEEVVALEARVGERISEHYRNFLLHANGWPRVYFNIGLFGIPEFDGEGNWQVANRLLEIYDSEQTLADAGLDVDGVMPIAAGEGMTDLIVIVRKGWPGAGQVVWFEGGELDRCDNFVEFVRSLVVEQQMHAEQLAAPVEESL